MTLTTFTVSDMFERCRWTTKDLDNQRVRINGFLGKWYVFHKRRLGENERKIVSMLSQLNRYALRSRVSVPQPWFLANRMEDGIVWGGVDYVDKLLSLGMAIDAVTKFQDIPGSVINDMPGVIIENERVIRKEKTRGHSGINPRIICWV